MLYVVIILVSIMLGYKITRTEINEGSLFSIYLFYHQSLVFQDKVLNTMTYFVSVFIIFCVIPTSMQEVTFVVKEKVTLQDEVDVKSIIRAFYDGLCLGDENCLRPISYCDESLGVVSSSTQGRF